MAAIYKHALPISLPLLMAVGLTITPVVHARTRYSGWCQQGNQTVITPAVSASTTKVQRSYPGCTVTVYQTGTLTAATLYSDDAGTSRTNPFTATSDGSYFFYADDGKYDVVTSGAGQSTPKTIGDVRLMDPYFTASGTGAVALRYSEIFSYTIQAVFYGAKCDGTTDDRAAIQRALNAVPATGAQVELPNGVCVIADSLWIKSHTHLKGKGGRSGATVIKRKAGMYTDAIIAGLYDGSNHSRSTYSQWIGGLPYTVSNVGYGIQISGIYIDGNGTVSGQPPLEPNPPLASYRGSGIFIQWVDGVSLDDVVTQSVSNDGAWIGACRHVTVTNSEFSNNFLLNPVGAGTRNGITIAGTMAQLDSSGDDVLIVSNVIAQANENLGIAVQARSPGGLSAGLFGGIIIVTNSVTKGNRDHGILVEAGTGCASAEACGPVKGVVISNNLSTGDGVGTANCSAGIGAAYAAHDILLSNNVVRNSGCFGMLVAGAGAIVVSGNIIDGYAETATSGVPVGIFSYRMNAANATQITLTSNQVIGGSGKSVGTIGISISGVDVVSVNGLQVGGTTAKSTAFLEGAAVSMTGSKSVQASNIQVNDAAGIGIYASGGLDVSVSNFLIQNYGVAAAAGVTYYGVWCSIDATGPTWRSCSIDHGQVLGGGARTGANTTGVMTSDFGITHVDSVYVDGTTYTSGSGSGIGIYGIALKSATVSNCTVTNAAGTGIYIPGSVPTLSISASVSFNNGQNSGAALRAGILVGPGSSGLRHGIIAGNLTYDDQGSPTQQQGIYVPISSLGATERMIVQGNSSWGNAAAQFWPDVVNSHNIIFGNDFYGTKAVVTGMGTLYGSIPYTVAALPTCSSTYLSYTWSVTDSTVNTWGATAVGGGSYNVAVRCNGTAWTVVGK